MKDFKIQLEHIKSVYINPRTQESTRTEPTDQWFVHFQCPETKRQACVMLRATPDVTKTQMKKIAQRRLPRILKDLHRRTRDLKIE